MLIKIEWSGLAAMLEDEYLLCLIWRYLNYATSYVYIQEKYKMVSDEKNRKLRFLSSLNWSNGPGYYHI